MPLVFSLLVYINRLTSWLNIKNQDSTKISKNDIYKGKITQNKRKIA